MSEQSRNNRLNPRESKSQERVDSGSLRSYYRQLGDSEPISPEAERALWAKVDAVVERMRASLCTFWFILKQHEHILDTFSASAVSDVFPASTFPETSSEREMQSLPFRLKPWAERISALAEKMERVCREEGCHSISLISLRKESAELLHEYPIGRKKLLEWYADACMFRASYFGTDDNLFAETRQTLEQKTCMPLEDFLRIMSQLEDDFFQLEELRRELVTCNLRLVVSIVQQHNKIPHQTADIIQEGNLGLIRAFDTFDYKLGYRFSTYAAWWIKQAVTRAIASQNRIIRLPAHMIATIVKIGKTEQVFLQRKGRIPSDQELADEMEMPRERISAIKKMACQTISLQAPMNLDEQEDSYLRNFLTDYSSENALLQMTSEHLMIRLKKAIESLNLREQKIIRLRYGLDNTPPKTLAEISEIFHVTRERIRQIEQRAIKKLRDPSLRTCYQDYFFER